MGKPKKEVRHADAASPRWVKAGPSDVKRNDDGTADVFAWGYVFKGCEVHYAPSDRFESPSEYVLVMHPTGNQLRVFWWS
jgi:hypothetical protein